MYIYTPCMYVHMHMDVHALPVEARYNRRPFAVRLPGSKQKIAPNRDGGWFLKTADVRHRSRFSARPVRTLAPNLVQRSGRCGER